MRLSIPIIVVGIFIVLSLPLRAYQLQTLTTNVNPLNGTASGGDDFPGAVFPFGMIQWSPATLSESWGAEAGGYYYYDPSQIVGFGLDHISGAGPDYGGDFQFTPILGSVTSSPTSPSDIFNGKFNFPFSFSHTNEIAMPGYYSVQFNNGVRTELTTTPRTGFGRFTYPSGYTDSMVINACSGAFANLNAAGTINASIQINKRDIVRPHIEADRFLGRHV